MMRRAIALFVIWLATTFGQPDALAADAQTVKGPLGTVRPYTETDHYPHPSDERAYTETWSYECRLGADEWLLFNFVKTNIGVFSGIIGVQVWHIEGDQTLAIGREMPVDKFRVDKKTQTMYFSDARVMRGLPPNRHEVEVDIDKGPGVKFKLSFSDMAPGFVVGDGRFGFPKFGDSLRLMVAMPRAKVAGSLTIGGKTRMVSGMAYAEHILQTKLTGEMIQSRMGLRVHSDTHTVSMSVLHAIPALGGGYYGIAFVANDSGVVELFADFLLLPSNYTMHADARLPHRLQVGKKGAKAAIKLDWRFVDLRQRYAITQDMNKALGYLVDKLMGETVFFRMSGKLDLQYFVDGEPKTHTETALVDLFTIK